MILKISRDCVYYDYKYYSPAPHYLPYRMKYVCSAEKV